jgi:hypothetical protein
MKAIVVPGKRLASILFGLLSKTYNFSGFQLESCGAL